MPRAKEEYHRRLDPSVARRRKARVFVGVGFFLLALVGVPRLIGSMTPPPVASMD